MSSLGIDLYSLLIPMACHLSFMSEIIFHNVAPLKFTSPHPTRYKDGSVIMFC